MGKSSSTAKIVVRPRQGITPEQARAARTRASRFVFEAYRAKVAGTNGGKHDAKSLTRRKEVDVP